MADPFEALVAAKPIPAAPAADPFTAIMNKAPAVVDQAKPDPFTALVQQKGAPVEQAPSENLPIESQVWQGIKNAVPDSVKDAAGYMVEQTMKSPVGTVLNYLNKPMEAATGLAVSALDKTVAPGIEDKLNPERKWLPEIAFHDVVNYVAPTNDQAQATLEKYGFTGNWAQNGRLLYATGKTGIGLAADLFLDPLMYVGIGELTEAGRVEKVAQANKIAEGTFDAANAANPERYAVSYGAGAAKTGITTDTAASIVKAVPGGEAALKATGSVLGKAADIIKSLDYHTDIPEVDAAASLHAATKRGDYQYIGENFVKPLQEYKFQPAEGKILASAIEGTANEASRDEILTAAKENAARLGATIPDQRIEQIADAGMKIKLENAKDLAERESAGLFNSAIDNVLENYLVHKQSAEAKQWLRTNPEKAAAIQEAALKGEVDRGVRDTTLSTYDAGKRARNLKTTLEQANQILKEKTGVSAWFIEDPIVATAMKRAQTRSLIRDTELIGKMEKFGVEKGVAREAGLNWKELKVPEYKGALPSKDLVFPPKITDRIGYYITPRETGRFVSYLDSFNRVFRNVALFRADYYMRNWGENIFKNWVQGVKLEDYNLVRKVSTGKGFVELGGKQVPVSEVRSQIQKLGIDSGGQFHEGVGSLLDTGKKIESDRKLARAAGGVADATKKAINVLREGGESGENLTRRALFMNRLKQGYSPAAAALEVEKYLFDYGRVSNGMDAVRRFYNPFFQHAYKTLLITPEMLGKAPGKYNFLHNNMLGAIQAGINDPVTSAEVQQIIPGYQKMHDPVVGPILTGNSWLKRIFTNQTAIDAPGALGGKTAILFKADIGLSILNQFAIWNDELGKTGGLVAPFMRSFAIIATGRDAFTGKVVDPTMHSADMARRFNYALNSFAEGTVPIPEIWKFTKQTLGFGDPKYVTPVAVQLLHGTLGKFVTVTDLDREYFFRMLAFNAAHKELQKNLLVTASQEMREGRDGFTQSGNKYVGGAQSAMRPYFEKLRDILHSTESSAYLYNAKLKMERDAMGVRDSAAGLTGQMNAADIVKHLQDLDRTIEAQAKQYEAIQAYRLEQLKNAPPGVVRQLAPGSNPRQ